MEFGLARVRSAPRVAPDTAAIDIQEDSGPARIELEDVRFESIGESNIVECFQIGDGSMTEERHEKKQRRNRFATSQHEDRENCRNFLKFRRTARTSFSHYSVYVSAESSCFKFKRFAIRESQVQRRRSFKFGDIKSHSRLKIQFIRGNRDSVMFMSLEWIVNSIRRDCTPTQEDTT